MSVTVVVGFGVSGRAAAAAIAPSPVVVIEDRPDAEAVRQAEALGIQLVVAPDETTLEILLADASEIIVSPGIPPRHPIYRVAQQAQVPVISEIELAWRHLSSPGRAPAVLVAITGTNGKTTVATWVHAILSAAGRHAVLAGNIGYPLVQAADQPADVIVAEVSSFQLQYTEHFRPSVSCWLNLSEDHLDWHPTMAAYAAAKSRIWANQRLGDIAVINADDSAVRMAAGGMPPGVRVLSCVKGPAASGTDTWVDDGQGLLAPDGETFVTLNELPRRLPHDRANALAAAAVAWSAGADLDACRRGLMQAPLLAHRVALVADVDGVAWYDDSKATTPASVVAAVQGFASVVLIAGGRNKGLDLSVLTACRPAVRAVVAIGEAAPEVMAAFDDEIPTVSANDMDAAVRAAAAWAQPGDAVLLSPGCASFDWYQSYAERGDHFVALVQRLGHPVGTEASKRKDHHDDLDS
ncbi:MAG: UDP-N-acetylmuramoyl-L-alanine--D-glutamate ligase [Actinomycetota bacterium]|nr:UDP-N-acetylmuramoyl-L-alanine--D-glutamate ligase [Actinomycetota bacterium]